MDSHLKAAKCVILKNGDLPNDALDGASAD